MMYYEYSWIVGWLVVLYACLFVNTYEHVCMCVCTWGCWLSKCVDDCVCLLTEINEWTTNNSECTVQLDKGLYNREEGLVFCERGLNSQCLREALSE